jgi:MOSC domain-containing protein YiiM
VAKDLTQPNLRQVHLIHSELFEELAFQGHKVQPGDLGENITTKGLDILNFPEGTRLQIGPQAVVRVTGLRNPCVQIEAFQEGLLRKCLVRSEHGYLRKAGIMGVVEIGGVITTGNSITVFLPDGEQKKLQVV